ncbi:MAG: SGNH/GDSL hydrolase family protein, partial [Cyanobacteria bacterium J06614_10]
QFDGDSGTYDVIVTYFDEADGEAPFAFKLNGSTVDGWIADKQLGGTVANNKTRTTRTISNVTLSKGDLIELTAQEHEGELGRIDSVQFVEKGGPLSGNNGVFEIMPLGDSITRGAEFGPNGSISNRDLQSGYRDHLSNLLNNDGVNFDFVGSQNNGVGFDTDHEGHGGWKINQIASNITNWLASSRPEIILLKIGTNDMRDGSISVSQAISRLSSLIDTITSLRPTAELIVASIAPTNPADLSSSTLATFPARVVDYNSQIPGLVNSKANAGKNVSFVDVASVLDPAQHLEADGFHPNDTGNQLIAQAFSNAINNVISSSSSATTTSAAQTASGQLIEGSDNDDLLTGTPQSESIRGGRGNDTLTGLGGADAFVYASALDGEDTITDFSQDDRFIVSASGFGGGLTAGTLLNTNASSSGSFVSGSNPVSLGNAANFLFNTDTGTLQFDQDGLGSVYGPVNIAQLTNFSQLSNAQIVIGA